MVRVCGKRLSCGGFGALPWSLHCLGKGEGGVNDPLDVVAHDIEVAGKDIVQPLAATAPVGQVVQKPQAASAPRA